MFHGFYALNFQEDENVINLILTVTVTIELYLVTPLVTINKKETKINLPSPLKTFLAPRRIEYYTEKV